MFGIGKNQATTAATEAGRRIRPAEEVSGARERGGPAIAPRLVTTDEEHALGESVVLSRLEDAVGWGRK